VALTRAMRCHMSATEADFLADWSTAWLEADTGSQTPRAHSASSCPGPQPAQQGYRNAGTARLRLVRTDRKGQLQSAQCSYALQCNVLRQPRLYSSRALPGRTSCQQTDAAHPPMHATATTHAFNPHTCVARQDFELLWLKPPLCHAALGILKAAQLQEGSTGGEQGGEHTYSLSQQGSPQLGKVWRPAPLPASPLLCCTVDCAAG
jgi:hypothetical protein